MIKNWHLDCIKDKYEIFQNNNWISDQQWLKILDALNCLKMVNLILLFKKVNISLSSYVAVISVPTRILVSGDLAYFATILKIYTSEHLCHWCMLSPKEWETCGHKKVIHGS